ncbi:MAG: hypothetical protein ACRDIB_00180 [Ardenticatenaceae bacterium]
MRTELDRVFWDKAAENLAAAESELINRRKRYPTALRSTLNQTYTLREKADYTTDHAAEIRAGRAVSKTEAFLDAIGRTGGETA